MTDAANRATWDQRLARYRGFAVLYDADTSFGPLSAANTNLELRQHWGRPKNEDQREAWEAATSAAYDKERHELSRHMREIYEPAIQAALALIRTPAPDLAAVRIKHDAINSELGIMDYEDRDEELFDIIRADVRRLIGEGA